MNCICVHFWIIINQEQTTLPSHHTGLYVTTVFRVCSAWLQSCQSKGWQVEVWCVVSFSWMNINTIHAITTLVIFRGLFPQPDSHRSNLMKTLNLLVRLIVYMGKLNALGRMWGHDETKAAGVIQRGNESKPGPTSGKFDSV